MDLATSCYAHACGKFPNNLELMMGLFNCYVREYSFVKQQQVGLLFDEQFLCVLISLCIPFLMSCFVTDSHQNVQTCRRREVLTMGSL